MAKLVRVSISLEEPLYREMERLLKDARYRNRSEFIRDLIRGRGVVETWEKNEEALGTVTLVFDHARRRLSEKLTHLQHEHHTRVLVSTHLHLSERLCAEMIVVRGRAAEIRNLADLLGQQKGVLHTALAMSSTGKKWERKGGSPHAHS